MIKVYYVLLLVGITLTIGCARTIQIEEAGFHFVKTYPSTEQVHPYPDLPDIDPGVGSYLKVIFDTEQDLEALAKKYTHHLYFNLQPCTQIELGYDLWSGGVFKSGRDKYAVYIPLSYEALFKHASGYGALDIDQYIKTAEKDGVCIIIGGGNFGWGSLKSNLIVVPARIKSGTIVVSDL
ncbi:hypothetical protein [Saccharophagus degradans]|uniref:Uncharacterized protein n=1 Tax=Saccharophagus degradans TaxID=86304 RepID=A0AAW7X1P8_9GAMM|nr:hypothetical protein [Saccharophagus degradans]MDO6421548.1 hypothetical protein [Saccharophagus degradans]MDO6608510.1 hypothetical protein [Saccharophagus degradans]